jgi:hypothetical protein
VVGKVISATAGVIEDAPHGSRLITTLERAVHQDSQKLEIKRKQLMKANVDSQTLDSARKRDGKVKMLTQGLPPLAFGIARDMKSLVKNIEGTIYYCLPGRSTTRIWCALHCIAISYPAR